MVGGFHHALCLCDLSRFGEEELRAWMMESEIWESSDVMLANVRGVMGEEIRAFSSVMNLALSALCQAFSGEGSVPVSQPSSHFKLMTVTKARWSE